MDATNSPWFEAMSGSDIEPGDLLEECPVFSPSFARYFMRVGLPADIPPFR